MSSIGLRTHQGHTYKSKLGYTFERICTDCHKKVYLKIKLIDGTGTISYNENCIDLKFSESGNFILIQKFGI